MTGIAIYSAPTPFRVAESAATSVAVFVGPASSNFAAQASVPSFVVIHGEQFAVEVADARYYVVHPQWSLMGSGRNLTEAAMKVELEIVNLRRVMASDTDDELGLEARRLRAFVMSSK